MKDRPTPEPIRILDVEPSSLVRRLRSHLAMLAPHQKERMTGKLLIEATEEIERLHAAILQTRDAERQRDELRAVMETIAHAGYEDPPHALEHIQEHIQELAQKALDDLDGDGPAPEMPSLVVKRLRHLMAAAAQEEYDGWTQEEPDGDPELGWGGICDAIAGRIAEVLSDNLVDCFTRNTADSADNHTHVVANLADGVHIVDIHPGVYETGGGYNWRKIPGVVFSEDDITITRIGDPMGARAFSREAGAAS